MKTEFEKIYENKLWGDDKNYTYSGSSGVGSNIKNIKNVYLPFLKSFLIRNKINSVTDLGCGVFTPYRDAYNENINYDGYDVYDKVIDYNKIYFSNSHTSFTNLDFYNNLDDVVINELIIIKDVFQHWPNNYIENFMYKIINKKFKYILIVNNILKENDCVNDLQNIGDYREISCCNFPLNKFKPIIILVCGLPCYKDKQSEISLIIK
jgi:hypothetical protein